MHQKYLRNTLMACLALTASLAAMGQQVYRCEINGKASYSHEPCAGAKAIDTTPTQGMDKMNGKSKKGADVQKAESDRQLAQALQPMTGQSPEAFEVTKRRMNLSALDKHTCSQLDYALPQLAQNVAQATPEQKDKAEGKLYKARKAYRDIRC